MRLLFPEEMASCVLATRRGYLAFKALDADARAASSPPLSIPLNSPFREAIQIGEPARHFDSEPLDRRAPSTKKGKGQIHSKFCEIVLGVYVTLGPKMRRGGVFPDLRQRREFISPVQT